MVAAPFTKSWWVDPPLLLAGCYPGDPEDTVARRKLTSLLNSGIRVFISLQEEQEALQFSAYQPVLRELATAAGSTIVCQRFPIRDLGIPSRDVMNQILDAIDRAIGDQQPVYVHCWGGHGRTATVVGCWLIRHGLTGEKTLARIARLRSHDPLLVNKPAPQTHEQISLVREWAQYDRFRDEGD